MEATSDGKVIQEKLVEGKAHQLWKKGTPDGHDSEFVKKNNVKRQPEYKDLTLFQVKDGKYTTTRS